MLYQTAQSDAHAEGGRPCRFATRSQQTAEKCSSAAAVGAALTKSSLHYIAAIQGNDTPNDGLLLKPRIEDLVTGSWVITQ